jgi:site-specific DNA-cytosine methylase
MRLTSSQKGSAEDITKTDPEEYLRRVSGKKFAHSELKTSIDLIVGGPPCQVLRRHPCSGWLETR